VRSQRAFIVAGLALALGLALLVAPWADSDPDGLERVARDKGFADRVRTHHMSRSPLADYSLDRVANERLARGASGFVGVLLTFGAGVGLFAFVRARNRKRGRQYGSSS
jgi:cobalt/nickel transport system permease protein